MLEPVLKRIMLMREPVEIDDFKLGACAYIGENNKDGADYFYFKLVTPKRIIKLLNENKIIDGRATFIVNEADMESNLELVKTEINKILQDCARPTWDEVTQVINRYLEWEYNNTIYLNEEDLLKMVKKSNKDN